MQNSTDNRVVASDGTVGWADKAGQPFFRFGWDALSELGRRLCQLVNGVRPLITRSFGDNVLIMSLLELIEILCPMIDDVAIPLADGLPVSDDAIIKQRVATDLRRLADKLDGGAV